MLKSKEGTGTRTHRRQKVVGRSFNTVKEKPD